MKVNITELLVLFDELLPVTNEVQGYYWFRSIRFDGIIIDLIISQVNEQVSIVVNNVDEVRIGNFQFTKCSEIRVLDEKLKCFEILNSNEKGRCFVTLIGDSIMDYTDDED